MVNEGDAGLRSTFVCHSIRTQHTHTHTLAARSLVNADRLCFISNRDIYTSTGWTDLRARSMSSLIWYTLERHEPDRRITSKLRHTKSYIHLPQNCLAHTGIIYVSLGPSFRQHNTTSISRSRCRAHMWTSRIVSKTVCVAPPRDEKNVHQVHGNDL